MGNLGGRLLDVVGMEEMRIVDPGEMDALVLPRDGHGFVQEHPDAHLLERGHHAD